MEKANLVVTRDELQVVDGKVIIASEELAKAIQDYDVNLSGEEMAEGLIDINLICPQKGGGLK